MNPRTLIVVVLAGVCGLSAMVPAAPVRVAGAVDGVGDHAGAVGESPAVVGH